MNLADEAERQLEAMRALAGPGPPLTPAAVDERAARQERARTAKIGSWEGQVVRRLLLDSGLEVRSVSPLRFDRLREVHPGFPFLLAARRVAGGGGFLEKLWQVSFTQGKVRHRALENWKAPWVRAYLEAVAEAGTSRLPIGVVFEVPRLGMLIVHDAEMPEAPEEALFVLRTAVGRGDRKEVRRLVIEPFRLLLHKIQVLGLWRQSSVPQEE